jgi:hypothetical protein
MKKRDMGDPTAPVGAVLRDLDALAARYAATRETLPPERRDALEQSILQAYRQVKLAANGLLRAYRGTV